MTLAELESPFAYVGDEYVERVDDESLEGCGSKSMRSLMSLLDGRDSSVGIMFLWKGSGCIGMFICGLYSVAGKDCVTNCGICGQSVSSVDVASSSMALRRRPASLGVAFDAIPTLESLPGLYVLYLGSGN